MKLWAIADLHVGYRENRDALGAIPDHPDDWLIVAGDAGDSPAQFDYVLRTLVPKFRQLVWVPGNHDLWTPRSVDAATRGVAHYERLVAMCRQYGVLTPEDPFAQWPGDGPLRAIVPMFLLYDYSFGPDGFEPAQAVQWAMDGGILCADETRLRPDPYESRQAWCSARLAYTRSRLEALPPGTRTMLVNHWPLRRDLVRLYRIPRFVPWCGTRRTEDWHLRYGAEVVVSGHLHMRATDWRDGVRFEEISLGYPRQYDNERGAPGYLRQIWPAIAEAPAAGDGGPVWHR